MRDPLDRTYLPQDKLLTTGLLSLSISKPLMTADTCRSWETRAIAQQPLKVTSQQLEVKESVTLL